MPCAPASIGDAAVPGRTIETASAGRADPGDLAAREAPRASRRGACPAGIGKRGERELRGSDLDRAARRRGRSDTARSLSGRRPSPAAAASTEKRRCRDRGPDRRDGSSDAEGAPRRGAPRLDDDLARAARMRIAASASTRSGRLAPRAAHPDRRTVRPDSRPSPAARRRRRAGTREWRPDRGSGSRSAAESDAKRAAPFSAGGKSAERRRRLSARDRSPTSGSAFRTVPRPQSAGV